jgi:hypothetical protein
MKESQRANHVPSLDSVPAKRMVKIQNQLYVLFARWVITKTNWDKQIVFHAFQASTRTKQEKHHANRVQPTKTARTLPVQNVTLVALAKSPNKVVLNVPNVMLVKLELELTVSVHNVKVDNTVLAS